MGKSLEVIELDIALGIWRDNGLEKGQRGTLPTAGGLKWDLLQGRRL